MAGLHADAPQPPGATPALRDVVPPVVVGQAQSAEYQAFMASMRQRALLEATMQKVAEAGQQGLQRLARRVAVNIAASIRPPSDHLPAQTTTSV